LGKVVGNVKGNVLAVSWTSAEFKGEKYVVAHGKQRAAEREKGSSERSSRKEYRDTDGRDESDDPYIELKGVLHPSHKEFSPVFVHDAENNYQSKRNRDRGDIYPAAKQEQRDHIQHVTHDEARAAADEVIRIVLRKYLTQGDDLVTNYTPAKTYKNNKIYVRKGVCKEIYRAECHKAKACKPLKKERPFELLVIKSSQKQSDEYSAHRHKEKSR